MVLCSSLNILLHCFYLKIFNHRAFLTLQEYLTEEMLPSSDFVNCCNDHDLCYETCGSDKDECDLKFKKCLYKTCTRKKEHVTKLKHKCEL